MIPEQTDVLIKPCLCLRPDKQLCNTLIGITIGTVPLACVCPVCKSLYIVDPLHPQDLKMEGFGFMEHNGHRIEMYSGSSLRLIRDDLKGFFASQGIRKLYEAQVYSEPGQGLTAISALGAPPQNAESHDVNKGDKTMSNTIPAQKELYKNHLEFLGYRVEYDTDDEQEITATREGTRTFIRVFTNGLRAFRVYRISTKAQSEKLAFLEFINRLNRISVAKIYSGDDWVTIELWYLCPYEKVSFGQFLTTLQDETGKFIDETLEKGFAE